MKSLKLPLLCYLTTCLLSLNACEELVEEIDECSFSYGGVAFTQGAPGQQQNISPSFDRGEVTGTFSSEPSGLSLDDLTGIIDVNASVPQEYIITHEGETNCETSIVILPGEQECVLSYDRTIVAPGETDFLVARVNDAAVGKGKFYATPAGLAISEINGSIDVGASETGIAYTIYYESEEGSVFCQTQLTISGISYEDALVEFDDSEAIVNPVYVEQEEEPAPIGEYDFNQNAQEENLAIDNSTGAIDLKKTLVTIAEAEFDNERLPDGFTRKFTIEYRLPEQELVSNIEVQIFWYPTLSDVPVDILEVLAGRGITQGRLQKRPPYILTIGDYER